MAHNLATVRRLTPEKPYRAGPGDRLRPEIALGAPSDTERPRAALPNAPSAGRQRAGARVGASRRLALPVDSHDVPDGVPRSSSATRICHRRTRPRPSRLPFRALHRGPPGAAVHSRSPLDVSGVTYLNSTRMRMPRLPGVALAIIAGGTGGNGAASRIALRAALS